MKKSVAVVAILAAFAVPVAPVQAETVADIIDSCWVLPLLKDECKPDFIPAAPAPKIVAAIAAPKPVAWPVPAWWTCEPAPAGSGHLLDCE